MLRALLFALAIVAFVVQAPAQDGQPAPDAAAQPSEQPAAQPADQPVAQPAEQPPAAEPAPSEQPPAEQPAAEQPAAEQPPAGEEPAPADDQGEKKAEEPREKAKLEVSAGVATHGDQQWTRLAIGADIPLWRFGIFFDVELFFNEKGELTDYGWEFTKDTWARSVFRKIRYIRFNHEGDKFFFKLGGLSSVNQGYGFVVDRFTNMLHYPDEKLIGLQLEMNDLGKVGFTFQGLIGDFYDFGNDGGVMAARMGFKFLKATEVPIIKDLLICGQYGVDVNMYAPARDWDYTLRGGRWDRDEDGITDQPYLQNTYGTTAFYDSLLAYQRSINDLDSVVEDKDAWASREYAMFQLVGGDIGMPLIKSKVVGLDLYAHAASRVDKVSGWGFGAPGVALRAGPMWATVEYRHTEGRFVPGYFDHYYLDERIERYPYIHTKAGDLSSNDLNGVFGRLGCNIADVLIISGDYQYLTGPAPKADTLRDTRTDHRYEATACVGERLTKHIPKFKQFEAYIHKANVGAEPQYYTSGSRAGEIKRTVDGDAVYDAFFDKTPYLYWGYRIGFDITEGARLVWDSRHGYKYKNSSSRSLVSNNTVSIQTVITF